jgi:hypothetical protein
MEDPLAEVLEAVEASPDDAYWARRLIDLVRDPMLAWRLRTHLAVAVRAWVSHDVSFFVHERYLSEQLAVWAWPREVLDELDLTLALDNPSLTHLVLGRLWIEARRSSEELSAFYVRAARHLREVAPPFRGDLWAEAMSEALGVSDPKELALRADEILGAASPASRERTLLAILRGAARAGDWALYDAHRRTYVATAVDHTHGPNQELAELDTQRAESNLVRRSTLPDVSVTEPGGEVTSVRARPVEYRRDAETVFPPSRTRSES